MAKVGDVCELVPKYSDRYNIVRITSISSSHYNFETDTSSSLASCHTHSVMAYSFKVIASNVSSLAKFRLSHPEYFI